MMMPQPRENDNGETGSQELGEVEVDQCMEKEGTLDHEDEEVY
jgi:hypothetical protein